MTNAEAATPPTQELPIVPAAARRPRTDRRYRALVTAVRHHEHRTSHPAFPKRPADHALYRALDSLDPARPSAREAPAPSSTIDN
jgi:hypothetical protein